MMTIYINNNLNDNAYAYRNLAKRNPHGYNKSMHQTPKQTMSYKADDVWAAAWQAFVNNGNKYIKTPVVLGTDSNRTIVERLLADTTQITQESRDEAEKMRRYFNGLTFKVIEGKSLSPFMQSALDASNKNEITNKYDLAVIVSLPATYEKATERDTVDRRINWASGGYAGDVGTKVSAEIEIVKQVWSTNWNVWFVTGITSDDKVLFFSYKKQMNIGDSVTIQGTVKAHRDNSTQLNRVKVK